VEPGGARLTAEARQAGAWLPLFAEAERSREPVFLVADGQPPVAFLGPLAEMHTAILLPLWFGARPLGFALVAWARSGEWPDSGPLERLGNDLSLVVAQQQAEERAEHSSRQAAELAHLSRALSSAIPTQEILREIAFAAQWLTGAEFVAIARASHSLTVDVCEPGTAAIRTLLADEETEQAWRAAQIERRPVETVLPARDAIAPGLRQGAHWRILAHPLERPREGAGLLLAGWAGPEGTTGGAASVEPFAELAAAALDRAAAAATGGSEAFEEGQQAQPVLAALLDSVDCGVLLFDAAGALRAVNERFARILRIEPGRVAELGRFETLVARLAPRFADSESVAARWRTRFAEDEASWDELVLQRPEQRVLERFARPVFDVAGRRLGWMEIYRDVSDQRLIESRLFHTERMAAIGQLVSGVAHELNNPLTSIVGYAQLLLARSSGSVRATDLRPILAEAERASRIARNLLLFARESRLERAPVNVNEVVERTLALRGYELRRAEIRVDLDLDPRLPPALADATQLQQVLLNLIVNAEQAIQQGRGQGKIGLRTRRAAPDRIALEVADDGPGIAPELVARVFDPFFTTKPPGLGTGLGLSIVYSIVREHGGDVLVESQRGAGATFTVLLPAAAPTVTHASSRAQHRPAEPPASARPDALARRRERFLVVEDEPTVARLIADVLGEEGYTVDAVLDSREGLELARRNSYALILCDLRMPHLDGRALYGELHRQDHSIERRFVFVTGDTLAPHTMEFLEGSGVPYLAKPFRVEELKEVVRAALAAGGPAEPAAEEGPRGARTAARKR
jgi:signal transduction histidine kinase/CheY-like chemotaxis protein